MIKRMIEKLKGLFQLFDRKDVYWKDVPYHTGFYRFDEKYQNGGVSFTIGGIPCLAQYGCDEFIFYTETDLRGEVGVVCVEKTTTE